ncbi:phage tail protein [Variovorax sp. V15]|uniref:phage tail protein n=1 Tax=Variovorax sp. V15 TaxID=3065952 RepID=UPI0034E87EB3
MPAPPSKNDISGSGATPSNAQARSGFGALWENLWGAVGLLGSTGLPIDARAALGAQLEPGIVGYTAAASPPPGWLKRNGAAVSRTTYAALFAAIGTTYGAGDGSTTFNLPEARGEFDRGWDDGRGVDAGRVRGSFQADEIRSHTHVYLKPNQAGLSASFGGGAGPVDPASGTTNLTGGAETRPRNVAYLPIIKY